MKIVDDPKFDDLPSDLGRLFAAGAKKSFFSLPGWYEVVAKHGVEKDWQPRIYASEHAALLCCVPRLGRPREIHGCCNMYTTEHSILGDDRVPESVQQLATDVARNSRSTDAVVLPGLNRSDPYFAAALAGLIDAGLITKPYFCWATWYEPTAGCDFSAYLATRPSILTNTWRRKQGALERSSRVVFRGSQEMTVEDFIAVYEDVCRRSWKAAEPFPAFMPNLIRLANREGALRFGVLDADGKTIAAQFWIVWARRATIYKLAYDEKWRQFSPGTLLTMHMVRHVLERDRPDEIDFGRGDDPYKKIWMSNRRERWGIEAANPRTLQGVARSLRLRAGLVRDQFLSRKHVRRDKFWTTLEGRERLF